ncbi:hypothetical protein [uncultured Rothia sp.]|uniref:hypothetical protein n=1 Tax=uncultured Rothia sp. TaxID=316088 RepID=UPI003216BDB4
MSLWFLAAIIPPILIIGFTPIALILTQPPKGLEQEKPAIEKPRGTSITDWIFQDQPEERPNTWQKQKFG